MTCCKLPPGWGWRETSKDKGGLRKIRCRQRLVQMNRLAWLLIMSFELKYYRGWSRAQVILSRCVSVWRFRICRRRIGRILFPELWTAMATSSGWWPGGIQNCPKMRNGDQCQLQSSGGDWLSGIWHNRLASQIPGWDWGLISNLLSRGSLSYQWRPSQELRMISWVNTRVSFCKTTVSWQLIFFSGTQTCPSLSYLLFPAAETH